MSLDYSVIYVIFPNCMRFENLTGFLTGHVYYSSKYLDEMNVQRININA